MSRDIARAEPENRRQRIRLHRGLTLGAIPAIALGLGIALWRGAWDLALVIGLAAILIADFLVGTSRMLRQERTYRLCEARLCREESCRSLAELKRAELKAAYFSFRMGPFLGLPLDFGDERWWMPLSLRNWQAVWAGLDRAGPDLGLGDWRENPDVLRALLNRANTSIALPSSVQVQSSGWGRAGLRLLAAIVLGVVAGILADRLGFESLSAIASGAISGGLGSGWALAAIERKLVIEPPS